jgi:tRNA(fMet)-specific endonuclease VapC
VILDTNALSAFADGDPALGRIMSREPRLAIPVIVLGEFRYGIAGSRHRDTYENWLIEYAPYCDILDVTEDTTVCYAAIRVTLKGTGRPIPANDAWIAALALQHKLAVLSRDEHFDSVPDIRRVGW